MKVFDSMRFVIRKRSFWSFIIILIPLTLYGYNGVKANKVDNIDGSKMEGQGNGSDLEQKVLAFTIDGRTPKGDRQWHLEGDSAEIIGDEIHLNTLKAIAYGKDMTINLSSREGVYRRDKGEVDLIGNVDVVSDDGFTLKTEKATWSQNTKEIYTDELVHIRQEGLYAVGTGGMANSEDRSAILKKDVRVEMEPDTIVLCDGSLEISSKDNIAIFQVVFFLHQTMYMLYSYVNVKS